MTSANSVLEAGHPKLVLWDISEGCGGGREEGDQDGGSSAKLLNRPVCAAEKTKKDDKWLLSFSETGDSRVT